MTPDRITFRSMTDNTPKPPAQRGTAQIILDDHDMGPHMRALRPLQRNFVYAMFMAREPESNTEYARMAGYSGDLDTLKARAYKLAHSDKVQAAIREEAERRNTAILPWVQKRMEELILDRTHKDHFGALKHTQAIGGLSPKNVMVVEHKTDRASLMQEIGSTLELLKSLGVNVTNLAPDLLAPKTIDTTWEDAEYDPNEEF